MAIGNIAPFLWGEGGAKLTPDEIARQRKIVEALAGRKNPAFQNAGWLGVLGQGLEGAIEGWEDRRLNAAQDENNTYNDGLAGKAISAYLAGNGQSGAGSTMPMAGASGEIAATGPVQPIDMTGNEVFSSFIDTAKAGGLTNPYGLAALAATGKAESGFDPGNVNRTWSDPSESGEAGTAGGILSWRGPRYQALAATGDLSPAGQAKFFLQEDPALVAALNNAKSTEEAIGLMNNAWKFAGYDRPGGEAARRLAAAQGFLPSFQGGGEVAALTPEAAIDAVSPVGGSLADEVAEFEQTPAYAAQFPGGTQQNQQRPIGQMDTVAQALTSGRQNTTAINPEILRALTDPRANAQTRGIAEILLKQQMGQQEQQAARDNWLFQQQYAQQQQDADPLRALQLEKGQLELEALRNPQPGYQVLGADEVRSLGLDPSKVYQRSQDGKISDVGGSLVNVNVGGNRSKFGEESDKAAAGRLGTIVEDGMKAGAIMADMQQLSGLAEQIQTGRGAEALVTFGPYLQALGIDVDGLEPAQAYKSIIDRLAPNMRPAGAGATSDFDARQFLSSLPALGNVPGANEIINQTFQGISQNKIDAAAIARRAQREEITWQDAEDQISKLPNPYQRFKEWEKSKKQAADTNKRLEEMSDEELEAIINGQR